MDAPARTMQVVGDPAAVPEIVAEFQCIIDVKADTPPGCRGSSGAPSMSRRRAYCIVQTAETRFYGNIILSKGVMPPAA